MKFDRTHTDGQTVLRIEGALDALTVPEIRGTVDELIEEKVTPIVVDVSGLELIDSSGVAVIVSLYKRSKAHGGSVSVTGLNGQPLAIFKLLRLDRVFVS